MQIVFDTAITCDTSSLLNEDLLLDPASANIKLAKKNLKINKIEEKDGEKIIHIAESKSNLLLG